MGCNQSKIENEEALSRCKHRKTFMKDAVSSRNAFASAHSAYAMSLKNTGAALSDYAHGEVQSPQIPVHKPPVPAAVETLPPPPPPPANFPPLPLHRAASMPEFKMVRPAESVRMTGEATIEEENEEDEEDERHTGLRHRDKSGKELNEGPLHPPPSPPTVGSEGEQTSVVPPLPETEDATFDYFFRSHEHMPGPSLTEVVDEVRIDKDQVGRSMFQKPKKVDYAVVEEKVGDVTEDKVMELPEMAMEVMVGKGGKKVRQGAGEGKRGVKAGNLNLLQLFIDLDDHFLKASESAHEVSKMLEATRLHYHSNFADNRGHIDHAARVMRVITWNRSFRGLANLDDGKDDFDSEEHETHATVLDKMLAWEKKLYDEVKAGELMKYDYQRKVAHLNKLKKRGANSEALEKAKAAVSHLYTRYIVDMQSMDSTVSEINRLRDHQMYPKLVALVDGMATMWETMSKHHESQSRVVMALRSLENPSSPKETSEHHQKRTIQLWAVVREWNEQFDKLVIHQKAYIKALNSWLKLNLVPIESSLKERVSSPPRIQHPPLQILLHAWHDSLEKLPDEHARRAIGNFTAVMDAIVHHQEEEMKLKRRCEETKKELDRKSRQFDDWRRKYEGRRRAEGRAPDEGGEEGEEDEAPDEIVAERKSQVEMVRKRLEEEEEAHRKHCLQVRDKSLANLRTHLPELFRAMSGFSSECSEMFKNLRSISSHQNSIDS